jgi:hypothetical protein
VMCWVSVGRFTQSLAKRALRRGDDSGGLGSVEIVAGDDACGWLSGSDLDLAKIRLR